MNKTKIEWCDSTWNPVTGCRHGCEYCYARSIAHRFAGFEPRSGGEAVPDDMKNYGKNSIWNSTHGADFHIFSAQPMKRMKSGVFQKASFPYDFEPTFHRYRLDEPAQKNKPQTIFVCSMADLFGSWVPTKWIVDVFDACLKAPQHRYLFLTKNPQRYTELNELALLPRRENFWYGSTITNAASPIFCSDHHNKFASVEPILEPFEYIPPYAALVDWFIFGAETGNRAGKVIPEKRWVKPIVDFCTANGIPLFMKDSMASIWGEKLITEFPWG